MYVCVYVCFKISVSSEGTGADDAELDQHRFYDGQNSGQWNSTSRPLPSVFCTRGLTFGYVTFTYSHPPVFIFIHI